jgi:hypothetical protein
MLNAYYERLCWYCVECPWRAWSVALGLFQADNHIDATGHTVLREARE